MLPISISPNRFAAEPVTFITNASAPSASGEDEWSELEALAGVAVPASLREFYDDTPDWPEGLSQYRACQMFDVRRTAGNARSMHLEATVYERDEIVGRWRDIRDAAWHGAPDCRWPRHWLPVGDNGCGDIYAVSVETDERAPVIFVSHSNEDAEYVAESIADHAQNMRAQMAIDIYGELAGMLAERRVQLAVELQPDTHESEDNRSLVASEYQRRLMVRLRNARPGWKRVLLVRLFMRTIRAER